MSAPFRVIDITRLFPSQRWNGGRANYRPAGEPIDGTRYGVDVIDEKPAKAFVTTHHYSGSYPAARVRVGLFRAAQLVGVAVFSVPCNPATVAKYTTAGDGVELGRLVLLDDVPANGETWFLRRAFKEMRRERPSVGAVISYSDPVVRTTLDGAEVMPGHIGCIYQAFNARYVGRSRKETIVLDPHGRVVSRRTMSKLRNDESGARYAYERLRGAGAPVRQPGEGGAAYVDRALRAETFRRFRHPGNHVYVWCFAGAGIRDRIGVGSHGKPLAFPKARSA